MVKLIENTVKGLIQLPAEAEGTTAGDLLRRILVPNPKVGALHHFETV